MWETGDQEEASASQEQLPGKGMVGPPGETEQHRGRMEPLVDTW